MGLSVSAGLDVLRREFCEFVESGEGKGTKPLGLARGRCQRRDLAVGFRSLAIVHCFEFGLDQRSAANSVNLDCIICTGSSLRIWIGPLGATYCSA
ncbi:hypothetical protein FCV25MIE_09527 [Fagus crenata]